MKIYEAILPVIGGVVAIDPFNHQIAIFKKPGGAFIDSFQSHPLSVWNDKGLTLDGVFYEYQVWHKIEKDTAFYNYMKDVIQHDAVVQPNIFGM